MTTEETHIFANKPGRAYDPDNSDDAFEIVKDWDRLADGSESELWVYNQAAETLASDVWLHLRRFPGSLETFRALGHTPTFDEFESALEPFGYYLPNFIYDNDHDAEDVAYQIDECKEIETITADEAETLFKRFGGNMDYTFKIHGHKVILHEDGDTILARFPDNSSLPILRNMRIKRYDIALTYFKMEDIKVSFTVYLDGDEALEYAENRI